ncbi:DUF3040 domain-containing protein [Streptomyces sp. NPDC001744]|uniref:DUF3040 domain-containing protein n=1 Tax=Streptomyces sp. NPDC001744 TaxID=3364606 RepID=UPI0036C1B714
MGEVRLSAYERRVLAEIEARLERDDPAPPRRPAPGRRGLRSSPSRAVRVRRRLPALGLAALVALTLVLLVLAATTGAPAFVWAFAVVWALTLLAVLGALAHWVRRRTAESRDIE